jgi:hypothetical protein
MTLLEDIVAYFKTKDLIQGDGIDTFRDFMPETPDNIISLHEYKGDPVSRYTNVVHRSVQIVVRNKSAVTSQDIAKKLCQSILDDIADNGRVDFTPTRWGQVHIRQTPHKFSQDESDRVLYGFNLGITTTME